MQNLFSLPQDQVPQERGFLLSRIGAERIDKRSLSVAQAELHEMLADEGWVGVHGLVVDQVGENSLRDAREGSDVSLTGSVVGWVHVWDAALLGFAHLFGPVDGSRSDLPQANAQACVESEEGKEERPGHLGLLLIRRTGIDGLDAEFIELGAQRAKRFHDVWRRMWLDKKIKRLTATRTTQIEKSVRAHGLRCLRFLLGGAATLDPREIAARDLPRNSSQLLESSGVLCGHISLLLPGIDSLAAYSELTCKS